MKKPYDPKLRECAEEFTALCKKYDCAGFVHFVSPTHSEFVMKLDPSWSVVKIDGENMLRFRSKSEDFPNRDAQRFATESSVHMLAATENWARMIGFNMKSVLTELRKHMTIVHREWGTPDSVPGDGK